MVFHVQKRSEASFRR